MEKLQASSRTGAEFSPVREAATRTKTRRTPTRTNDNDARARFDDAEVKSNLQLLTSAACPAAFKALIGTRAMRDIVLASQVLSAGRVALRTALVYVYLHLRLCNFHCLGLPDRLS